MQPNYGCRRSGLSAWFDGDDFVFTAVGDVAPTDPSAWLLEGLITKTTFDKTFDGTDAGVAWVTANWYSGTGQTGMACQPVSINLPATNPLPQTERMKLAA